MNQTFQWPRTRRYPCFTSFTRTSLSIALLALPFNGRELADIHKRQHRLLFDRPPPLRWPSLYHTYLLVSAHIYSSMRTHIQWYVDTYIAV
jgi:hypothetical protein